MTADTSNTLVWFRSDLRIQDNQNLLAACEHARAQGRLVRALFIATPAQWSLHDVAPIQLDFIERQLNQLALALAALGIPLDVAHVDSFKQIPEYLVQYTQLWQVDYVFASSEPEFNERQRDVAVAAKVQLVLCQQHCLLAPLTVLNLSGEMYKVFSPFANKWREVAQRNPINTVAAPKPMAAPQFVIEAITLNCSKLSSRAWPVGEQAGLTKLRQFALTKVADYQANRDFPAIDGTSQISAYLAIGAISARQCVVALLGHYPDALSDDQSPGRCWLNEIIWREFYRHLLVAFPRLSKGHNYNRLADNITWRNDKLEFKAWCDGNTGYPLVDAAMRQLNQTGWMHNRLRMVVASFLSKHLLIDWRWGERYFKQKLIDGDLAANNGGWQWSAGTGCDAQPYFRVFNPISQCEKFDPSGSFVRKYLPELEQVDLKLIHKLKIPLQAELFSDTSYIYPIVEHKFARDRALKQLAAMKRRASKVERVDLDKEIFG